MVEKSYIVDTFHNYNGKNWLGSEVGAVKKTSQVDDTVAVVEDGRKVVKSGTYVSAPVKGLVLSDVDVTDGPADVGVLVRGSYIDANLPASVASHKTDLVAQGLYEWVDAGAVRPDFGGEEVLTALTIGTVTASGSSLSWTAVTNAVGYDIYFASASNGSYSRIASVDTNAYTAAKSGYYKVAAIGDHLAYDDSVLSNAVNVA